MLLCNGYTSNAGVVTSGFWIPGVYSIRLITDGVAHCRDTAYARLVVLPGPHAEFQILPGLRLISLTSRLDPT